MSQISLLGDITQLTLFRLLIPSIYFYCFQGIVHGEISFANYYANSMVLQSEPYRANVWGYGDGTNIGQEVTLKLDNKEYTTTIKNGNVIS